ncbi:SDR family oxidoreductase [bacterium]|nr:SDR family oxidoreductase [bacterium]
MEKTVLITGASSGIGKETAMLFANNGYKVFACIRKKSDKNTIEKIHKNIKGVYLDVTNTSGIDKAFWYVMKNTSKLDAIINCAGIAVAGPMEALSVKRIKEQFEINTFGTISVIQKFLPMVYDGKIIYISSMASSGIFPFLAPYCASKRATDIMLNSLSNEFKNKNIKIISIKPGCIITPFWNKSIKSNLDNANEYSERIMQKYKKEFQFLKKNAEKNNYQGSRPIDVATTILKAVESNNPKLSYTVGKDAFWVMLISKICPQNLLNTITKTIMKKRIEKY